MEKRVLIQELADALSSHKNISKRDAEYFIRTAFEIIEEYLLAEQQVKVKGIGTFKLVTVDSRESINVHTGERITINSHSKISFTPDSTLRDRVNKPFADFETVVLNEDTKTEDMERIAEEPSSTPEEPTPSAEPPVPQVAAENSEVEETPTEETPKAEETPIVGEEPTMEEVPTKEEDSPAEEDGEALIASRDVRLAETEKEQDVPENLVGETTEGELEHLVPQPAPPHREEKQEKRVRTWPYVLVLLIVALLCWLFFAFERKDSEMPVQSDTPVQVEHIDTLQPSVPPTEEPKMDIEDQAAQYPQVKYGKYWMVGTRTTHVLQRGEDLTQLAVEYYGDKQMISYIIKYNGIKNPSKVLVGTKVEIPEIAERTK